MLFVTLLVPFLLQAAHAQLNTLAKAAGLEYFGSATDNGELSDAPYLAILSDTTEFGQITPGNTQKWDTIEPVQDQFSFTKGDVIASLAKTNGQLLRCHTLAWHSQLPSWVSNGSWNKDTLTAALKNHVTKTAAHYKGQCYAWDVVNEALNDDGTFRESIFYRVLGDSYIQIAFEAAAAADPDAKLYYNDYSIEFSGAKATGALNIVKKLQAAGVKIDGVGFQSHFISGAMPSKSDLSKTISSFTALGVEVAITELDIRIGLPTTEAKLQQQSTDYQNAVAACLEVTGCIGITIWDFTDKYSWVPSTFAGQGAALPWDENLVKKAAYSGIVSALSAAAKTNGGASTTQVGANVATKALSSSTSSAKLIALKTPGASTISGIAKYTPTPSSAPSPTIIKDSSIELSSAIAKPTSNSIFQSSAVAVLPSTSAKAIVSATTTVLKQPGAITNTGIAQYTPTPSSAPSATIIKDSSIVLSSAAGQPTPTTSEPSSSAVDFQSTSSKVVVSASTTVLKTPGAVTNTGIAQYTPTPSSVPTSSRIVDSSIELSYPNATPTMNSLSPSSSAIDSTSTVLRTPGATTKTDIPLYTPTPSSVPTSTVIPDCSVTLPTSIPSTLRTGLYPTTIQTIQPTSTLSTLRTGLYPTTVQKLRPTSTPSTLRTGLYPTTIRKQRPTASRISRPSAVRAPRPSGMRTSYVRKYRPTPLVAIPSAEPAASNGADEPCEG